MSKSNGNAKVIVGDINGNLLEECRATIKTTWFLQIEGTFSPVLRLQSVLRRFLQPSISVPPYFVQLSYLQALESWASCSVHIALPVKRRKNQ